LLTICIDECRPLNQIMLNSMKQISKIIKMPRKHEIKSTKIMIKVNNEKKS